MGESEIWRKVEFGGNLDLGRGIWERDILGQWYFGHMGFWESGFCGRLEKGRFRVREIRGEV